MNGAPTWQSLIVELLRLPSDSPAWLVATAALSLVFLVVVLPSAALVEYFDRKLSADFQARVGPNRAGPAGILQPVADFLKLLQKQSTSQLHWREALWLSIHTMVLYSTVAVLPLGSLALLVDTDMSAFIPFWAVLVLALGTMFFGFSQSSVPGWLGGIRVAAQAMAGAFPALVALLCVGIRAGGFRWSEIATSQGSSPLHWTLTANPFQCLAFVIFTLSGLIILGIPPFDAALSTSDIQGGVASRLYGRRLSLFRLGRFYGFFLWSVISVVLFLGAWVLPPQIADALKENQSWQLLQVCELVWLLSKAFFLMLVIVWVARVSPRARVDQTTDLSWKILSPGALFALVGAGICAGWRAFG